MSIKNWLDYDNKGVPSGGGPPIVFIPPAQWKSSFTASGIHFFYSATVSGIQRDPGVEPAVNAILMYQLASPFTFKKNKTYQYELEVKGNFQPSVELSISYQWTSNLVYNDIRTDKVIPANAGTGSRYYFYSSPYSNTTTVNSAYFYAKGSAGQLIGTSVATSPRITNLKITEIDWIISGYKRYNPGTSSLTNYAGYKTISDANYDGWSYDKPIDTFWWTNKPASTMGATGLAVNGDISTNYIAKSVPYSYFNLTFQYQTFTGSFGSASNNIKIQTAGSLLGARTTLYTLTQSTATNSAVGHQIYGLQGNGKYLFFVGSTTSNTSGFQAAITGIKIEGGYHPNNNQQFLFTNSGSYSNPTILQILGTAVSSMTFSFVVGDGSTIGTTPSNLNLINAQFGNGTFRAGVWENGVWNSGWRVDNEIYNFDNVGVAFRTIADRRWRIQLTGSTSSVSQFNIGDRISVGNIVAIDINETRKLLKGYFIIINKSDTSIIVETDVSFPFRRIEKDSLNHRIKVTKNVWLSGAFLNGYYTGIWNYGLFKGFPRITEMFDTQWIDGIFDGGHFNSIYEKYRFVDSYYTSASALGLTTSIYEGKLGLSFSTNSPHGYVVGDTININKDNKNINPQYDGDTTVIAVIDSHLIITNKIFGDSSILEGGITSNIKSAKGLIQNFRFYDNNIGGKISSQQASSEEVFQFNSWIDVNYYNTSAVNIGKPIFLYDTVSKLEYTQNNLYGYPTNDILSSESTFRDSYTFNKRNYKLGTKYKIYQDGIGKASEFEKPFNMAAATASNFIGLKAFNDYGWTFSGTYSKYERSVEETSYNANVSEEYAIKGEELIITSTMSGSVLNNTNINIENDRYTIVELDIKSYSVGTNSTFAPYYTPSVLNDLGYFTPIPSLNFNNMNQFRYSYVSLGIGYSYFTPMTYLPIWEPINHLLTPGIKKYEYFFNKPTLSMRVLGSANSAAIPSGYGGTYQTKVIMDNLKYYEVDMIPFFQYFDLDNIYKGVSIPWQGIAPFIDYTKSDFSFIDNISIGLGSVQVQQSFTPISGVGISIDLGGSVNPTYDNGNNIIVFE